MDNLNHSKNNLQDKQNDLPNLFASIENLENAVIILDSHYNCLFLNNAAEELFQQQSETFSVTNLLQSFRARNYLR
ncbi:MAG: hypothetical protein HC930_18575 [Hydrococcus sp. SU_1_0]|nr:hypothetical protein [Hydrococcus sp. SU_1_0]